MATRDRPCAVPEVAPTLPPHLSVRNWFRDQVGGSSGAVYRLARAGEPDLYLKHGEGEVADAIADEAHRMAWLGRYLPVPKALHFVRTPEAATLLMTALPGRTAWQVLSDKPDHTDRIVDALADFLRHIHAIPSDDCPFDSGAPVRLAQARRRVEAGLVDEDDFDDEQAGQTAAEVLAAAEALLPLSFERVVTHGDYSLDNIVMGADGQVAGVNDLGRVGVADPYQDIAILWNCLGEFGPAAQARLIESLSIAAPDRDRLRFHLLLDELF